MGGRGGFASAGQDRTVALDITLEEAYQGGQRSLQLQSPERDANGQVANRLRTLNVKIPAGVTNGQKIRLKGRGAPGRNGGPAGDLIVECHVVAHARFGRDGDNLTVRVPVSFDQAALGTQQTNAQRLHHALTGQTGGDAFEFGSVHRMTHQTGSNLKCN
jgi:DnaJ-class molecular chaperone